MKKFRLLKNAVLLTATGFLLRGLGMVLRVYVSGRIGEEGMGLYQLVSSVYFLFITLAQSGLSVTVTRLSAERLALNDKRGADNILKSALPTALFTGTFSCACMLALSGLICKLWIGDTRVLYSLRILALSLPFISVCNTLSAFFTAQKNVIYGCTAQIAEQLVRAAITVAAATRFSEYGLSAALAAVFFANTVSEAVSCIYLWAISAVKSERIRINRRKKRDCQRLIIRGAAPVAASRYLASALHTVENMLVPSAITLFTHSRPTALAQFGALKGMALPLLFFPASFLNALSTLLVPEITDAHARRDKAAMSAVINRSAAFTIVPSVMLAGIFRCFSHSLGELIYGSAQVSAMLFHLAPIVPFMYLDSICDGLLKGLGMQRRVLVHNCIDSALRILLTVLTVPRFGINGFIAVMVVSNISVSLMNFSLLLRTAKLKCDFTGWFLRPILCTVVSSIVTNFLFTNSANILKTALGCLFFSSVFLLLMLISGRKRKIYKI